MCDCKPDVLRLTLLLVTLTNLPSLRTHVTRRSHLFELCEAKITIKGACRFLSLGRARSLRNHPWSPAENALRSYEGGGYGVLKGFLRIEPSVAGQWKKGPGTLRTENIEEGQRVAVPSAFNRSSVFRLGEHH